MKVRKLAVALALAGGLGSGVAQALGLGDVELQSYLNEPLDAQIRLPQSRGVSSSDVFVNVAPESAYRRVGLNRDQFVSKLNFKVVTRNDGSLAVDVSSREPLREPYLNFLLELTWSNGRLLREYAVLVDPPVYAAETGVREPLGAASNDASRSLPAARNNDAANRPPGFADAQGDPRTAGSVYGPTGPSDTLWDIAARMRPDSSVSMQQTMLAIQELNPDAFISENINRLKRDEVLRAPTLAQIRRLSQGQANQAVAAQNRDVNSTRATIDAATARAPSQPATSGDDSGELKLIVADTPATETESERPQSGSANVEGSDADPVDTAGGDASSAVALEELESVRRENNELGARLDQLQEQVETLQRLLELKNNQLADIQQTGVDDGSQLAANAAPSEGGDPAAAEENFDQLAATQADNAANPTSAAKSPIIQPQPVTERGFAGGFFDDIMNNPIYQAVLGGLLLLLLLLLLLVPRRKNRDQEILEDDAARPDDTPDYVAASTGAFDLSLDDHVPAQDDTNHDVLTEVDSYLAYGQHEQAINALELAISREPSRIELRLKLLAVYADAKDRLAFERQYGELSALEDDEAMAEADRLLEDLERAEAAPSIHDLESELRSASFAGSFSDPFAATDDAEEPEYADDVDDFVLSDDFARQFADETAAPLSKADTQKAVDDDSLSLDESFLDELDAELDKNSDDPASIATEMDDLDLHALDLEVSDEDLALMDEFADTADSSNHAGAEATDELPEMTEAELQTLELGDDPEAEIEALEELDFDELTDEELPLASDEVLDTIDTPRPAATTAPVIGERELGDDDNFDFLAGTDEAATKLDLARAYVEMGDIDDARDILQEVELEGTIGQKAEAKEVLKNLC